MRYFDMMMVISLGLNIVVLIPVSWILAFHRASADRVFGPVTTAREILLSIYLAILISSVCLLVDNGRRMHFGVPLLVLQVIYKLLSTILIRDKRTPVLWFNLAIAIFHSITVLSANDGSSL